MAMARPRITPPAFPQRCPHQGPIDPPPIEQFPPGGPTPIDPPPPHKPPSQVPPGMFFDPLDQIRAMLEDLLARLQGGGGAAPPPTAMRRVP